MTTRSIVSSPVLRGETYSYTLDAFGVPFDCVYRVNRYTDMILFSVFYNVGYRGGLAHVEKDIYITCDADGVGNIKVYRLFATVLVLPNDVIYKISAGDYLYKHLRCPDVLSSMTSSPLPILIRLQHVLGGFAKACDIRGDLKVSEVI